MRLICFFLIFACANANAAVLLDEDLMTFHLMFMGLSEEVKRCADIAPMSTNSPQTSLRTLQANHAPLLNKGKQLVFGLTKERQAQAAGIAQDMENQLKRLWSETLAEKRIAHCAELSRWIERHAAASETALANEEMEKEVEKLFAGRSGACHTLSRDVEKAAAEFLASLQTVRPIEPDIMKILAYQRTQDNTKQAALKCEQLRSRAMRRQIDFPDGFNEMSSLTTAIFQATLLPSTEEENRAKELATAYLARIRSK